MKKVTKILIALLLIVVAGVGVLLYFQYDNISAIIIALNHSSEDIAAEMDDNREKLETEVEKYTSSPIKDISAEDEEKLLNGEITIEEVADKYNLPLDYMKDFDGIDDSSNANVTPDTQSSAKAIDDAISEGVSRMYALKAKYVNKLGELEREAIKEYSSLPKEKQNDDTKYSIVVENIDYIAQLEKNCDEDVAKVLSTLESELIRLNGDTDIIQILQDAYEEEKEVKKAYYLSL